MTLQISWQVIIYQIVIIWLFSGFVARPVIHWVIDEFSSALEKLEPEERDGADREIYRTCSALESLNVYAWIVCGPFLLPIALWGAAVALYGKLFTAWEGK